MTVILWAGILLFSGIQVGGENFRPVLFAWIMVATNTLAGYLIFEYAFDKAPRIFTLSVFGGLTARLLVLMALVFVIIYRDPKGSNVFVISLFAFYCIYLIVEVLGYQKKNKQKKNTA
ncbi:MAG: hypothetical protein WCH05_03570 [Chlorobiaceae bacterium]